MCIWTRRSWLLQTASRRGSLNCSMAPRRARSGRRAHERRLRARSRRKVLYAYVKPSSGALILTSPRTHSDRGRQTADCRRAENRDMLRLQRAFCAATAARRDSVQIAISRALARLRSRQDGTLRCPMPSITNIVKTRTRATRNGGPDCIGAKGLSNGKPVRRFSAPSHLDSFAEHHDNPLL